MSYSHSLARAWVSKTPAQPRNGRDHAADLDLVARARGGDADALANLVERMSCVPVMLHHRHRRLGSPLPPDELAEVEQDTLAALWDKLEKYAGRASFETWVYRFMVLELHKGLDRRRRQRRFQPDGESLLFECSQPEPSEPRIDPIILHDSLDRVGRPASDIIRMRHFDKLSFDEISDHTGERRSTVKARYYRGLVQLRALLAACLRRTDG